MAYYKDLREYIRALEASDKLVRIKRAINKDTELIPLVRWQFRGGYVEEQRKAFLFENVVDVKGKKYTVPVLVGAHASSTAIYAMAMKCQPEDIAKRLDEAQIHRISPKIVQSGVAQEEVHMGSSLLEHGGLEEFPVPNCTPGFDNAPYMTAAGWVSKDPGTGVQNLGVYRAMVKSPTRLGLQCYHPKHLRLHWQRTKAKGGKTLQAAVVLGSTPNVGLVSVAKVPFGIDEFSVAGAIAGEPVELVKCKTVDLEVPANSEIVIEGEIPTDSLEREGPFGEHTGYTIGWGPDLFFNITCITHRKNPIYNAFISQFPPSESSKLRTIATSAAIYKFLKHDANIPTVLEVYMHENSGAAQICLIKMDKAHSAQSWQALSAAHSLLPNDCKIVIVVDKDIDIRDTDSVFWALCYRMQPEHDIKVMPGKMHATDPSVAPPKPEGTTERLPGSALLIDATMKWPYPPTCLPAREFMEKARQIWEEVGLPKFTPKVPWFGYELGFWPDEMREEAKLALQGEYYQVSEKLARNRLSV